MATVHYETTTMAEQARHGSSLLLELAETISSLKTPYDLYRIDVEGEAAIALAVPAAGRIGIARGGPAWRGEHRRYQAGY